MKNCTLLTLLLMTFLTVGSMAQSSSTKSKKTGNEWHAAGDAIPRSKEFADRLTRDLALDETTSRKIFQAYLANTKPVDEIKMAPGSDEEKKELLNVNSAAFNETLKGILSPEQFTKYINTKSGKKE